jgi:hypothetical protein
MGSIALAPIQAKAATIAWRIEVCHALSCSDSTAPIRHMMMPLFGIAAMPALGPKESPEPDKIGAALHRLLQPPDQVGAVLAGNGHAGRGVLRAGVQEVGQPGCSGSQTWPAESSQQRVPPFGGRQGAGCADGS